MIRRQLVVPVNTEQLWNALTDPDQVGTWFGARVEWELREGAPARFWDDDGSERHGQVDVVRPYRHLRFRWWPAEGPADTGPVGVAANSGDGPGDAGERADIAGPAQEADLDPAQEVNGVSEVSEVSYVLEPDEGGTRLTIQERQVEGRARFRGARPDALACDSGILARGGMGPVGGQRGGWSAWDDRLAGAWIAVVAPSTALAQR
jgi:uncharacterized protein YndB with AHSA1/START domain